MLSERRPVATDCNCATNSGSATRLRFATGAIGWLSDRRWPDRSRARLDRLMTGGRAGTRRRPGPASDHQSAWCVNRNSRAENRQPLQAHDIVSEATPVGKTSTSAPHHGEKNGLRPIDAAEQGPETCLIFGSAGTHRRPALILRSPTNRYKRPVTLSYPVGLPAPTIRRGAPPPSRSPLPAQQIVVIGVQPIEMLGDGVAGLVGGHEDRDGVLGCRPAYSAASRATVGNSSSSRCR